MSVEVGKAYLEHFGVKGMKWGVRKKRSAKDERVRSQRAKTVEKRRTLSDDDLKKYIERLSNEKKLKDLIEADISPGKRFVNSVLSDSGSRVTRTVVTGAALYGIKVALTKKFEASDAAGYLAPRPKK